MWWVAQYGLVHSHANGLMLHAAVHVDGSGSDQSAGPDITARVPRERYTRYPVFDIKLRRVALRACDEMLGDDFVGNIFAATATAPDR
jgi:hypothetical protein